LQHLPDHYAEAEEQLASLRADFPQFRIWREDIVGTVRYVACRLHPGTHPHTVVTSDPGEIRAALSAGHAQDRPRLAGPPPGDVPGATAPGSGGTAC
jgi:hypothetical protein